MACYELARFSDNEEQCGTVLFIIGLPLRTILHYRNASPHYSSLSECLSVLFFIIRTPLRTILHYRNASLYYSSLLERLSVLFFIIRGRLRTILHYQNASPYYSSLSEGVSVLFFIIRTPLCTILHYRSAFGNWNASFHPNDVGFGTLHSSVYNSTQMYTKYTGSSIPNAHVENAPLLTCNSEDPTRPYGQHRVWRSLCVLTENYISSVCAIHVRMRITFRIAFFGHRNPFV